MCTSEGANRWQKGESEVFSSTIAREVPNNAQIMIFFRKAGDLATKMLPVQGIRNRLLPVDNLTTNAVQSQNMAGGGGSRKMQIQPAVSS